MPSARPGIRRSDVFPLALLTAFTAIWIALAISPNYRQDWLLENVLVLIAIPSLVLGYRRAGISHPGWMAIFLFLVFHEIGAHYTYSEVPYQQWFASVTGGTEPAWQRNHYDRAVHFLYGLLITLPAFEVIARHARPCGLWIYLLTFTFMLSHSLGYELIEWAAAVAFGGELGDAYLGTQGDVWDAQKDMALAALGTAITISALAIHHWRSGGIDAARASAVPSRASG